GAGSAIWIWLSAHWFQPRTEPCCDGNGAFEMNCRTTLILAVIALARFAYFRLFEMKRPSTEEATRQAQNVVNFDRNKVDGIVIKNGDQQIEIRRRESKWRLETPIKDQADGVLVDNLLSDLETWEKEGTIPAKDIE